MEITEIAVPTDGLPTPDITDLAHLCRLDLVHFFGHDDLVDSAETMAHQLANQVDVQRFWLIARDGDGHPLGAALATLPLRDNTTIAEWSVVCDPTVDIASVTTALWEASIPRLTAAGRTSVQCWQMHRDGGDAAGTGADTITPATGAGVIGRDAASDVAQALGFTLEQVYRHSVLTIDQHRHRWPALAAEIAAHHRDYEIISWHGSTPDELCDSLALLRNRMSVDAPSADLDHTEQVWDADRVRRRDATALAQGRGQIYAAARRPDTGALVAYTELDRPTEHPQAAWQDDTLVHGDHRGRRLGWAVKLEALDQLTRVADQVRRIHTWNADENSWMLAINTALGFSPASAEGVWQRRL